MKIYKTELPAFERAVLPQRNDLRRAQRERLRLAGANFTRLSARNIRCPLLINGPQN